MKLLASSAAPDLDQRRILTAVVAFWLLGATDGHPRTYASPAPRREAPGDPLYGVVSAQPRLHVRQIKPEKMRLATAVGDRRRPQIYEIYRAILSI